nr:MFS transporter [Rhodococcus sp. (in: high G+C Gram-positive bacteria)]
MVTAPPGEGLRNNIGGLLCLALASCLAVTTEMLPVGLLPAIGESFDVSESRIGLLVSVYAGLVAVLAVPLTVLSQAMPRKPLLLSTIAGYVVSNLVVAAAPSLTVVAAGRVVGGIAHALFFSLSIGYVPRLVGRAHLGRGLALAASGATAGYVLGVPLSTSLGTALGWRASFVVLAAFSLSTVLLVARFLPSVPGVTAIDDSNGPRKHLAAVAASNALTFLGHFTVYTYIAVRLLDSGASASSVGPWLFVFGCCGLVGLWLTGRTLDASPRRTTLTVLAIVIVALVLMGLLDVWFAALVTAICLWSGAFGGVPSMYQSAAVRTRSTSPEMAGAWVNATSNIGIAGGAAIGGVVITSMGVSALVWIGAAAIAAGMTVSVFCRGAFPS